ncbi:MAG: hypothetical protein U0640_03700 [Phycisphaerales bacterium]
MTLEPSNHSHAPEALSPADELLMNDLVQDSLEAERFEALALGHDATSYKFPTGANRASAVVAASGSMKSWMRVGSIAAAAAIAVGTFLVLRAPVNPANNKTLAITKPATSNNSHAVAVKPTEQRDPKAASTPRVEVARVTNESTIESLEGFAHLDPAIINGGIPTLTGDRSLVMAVYRGDESNCDCFKWAVKEVGDSTAAPEELASALSTPCAAASRAVTVVSITGPRDLLPFHDADAKELVQCIAEVAAETEIDADDLREATMAALCLPDELSVETKSVTLAIR